MLTGRERKNYEKMEENCCGNACSDTVYTVGAGDADGGSTAGETTGCIIYA